MRLTAWIWTLTHYGFGKDYSGNFARISVDSRAIIFILASTIGKDEIGIGC